MTVRKFIHTHSGAALDLITPDGRILLEPPQIKRLLQGKAVIAMPDDPRKAAYVQAEDLLEQEVSSAYPTRSLWRLASTYDPVERAASKHRPGMMRWRHL